MLGLYLLCAALGILVFALALKIICMRRAADELRLSLAQKLATDTNTLLSLSSRDAALRRLAVDLNKQMKELRAQRHRYVQGDIELKSAVTNISHDLRTPLTAISGYLDLLEQEETSDSVARYIAVIRNRTEVLKQLTEELFRYSIITSPDYDPSTAPVDVGAALEESILGFYAAFEERGIIPKIRLPERKVIRTVNRDALSRLFGNLLHNALKYSDGDLEIVLTETGKLFFSNAASTLTQTQVERLFDRFYTVENGRKSSGLGLSIARVLVEQMHGSISAKYANGKLNIYLSLDKS